MQFPLVETSLSDWVHDHFDCRSHKFPLILARYPADSLANHRQCYFLAVLSLVVCFLPLYYAFYVFLSTYFKIISLFFGLIQAVMCFISQQTKKNVSIWRRHIFQLNSDWLESLSQWKLLLYRWSHHIWK